MGFPHPKKTKWWTAHPEGIVCPTPTLIGPIFVGRSFQVVRFGSQFETNTKLFCGVISPISTANDYLNEPLLELQKQ